MKERLNVNFVDQLWKKFLAWTQYVEHSLKKLPVLTWCNFFLGERKCDSISKADSLQNREITATVIVNGILPLVSIIYPWITETLSSLK